MSSSAIVLGVLLCIGTLLCPMPQAYKLLRRRSSAGISVSTNALIVAFGVAQLCATLTIKWKALLACPQEGSSCALQLFDGMQQLISTLTLSLVLVLVVLLPPNNKPLPRRFAIGTLIALCPACGITVGISAAWPCSSISLLLAQGFSSAGAILATVAFLPQLIETWRRRGDGSLSYIFVTINAAGCLLVVGQAAFINGDPWPAWLPNLISALFQTAILALGAYYRLRERRTAWAVRAVREDTGPLARADSAMLAASILPG